MRRKYEYVAQSLLCSVKQKIWPVFLKKFKGGGQKIG
jgi:hypothetical protein